jgi:hypothetical protein
MIEESPNIIVNQKQSHKKVIAIAMVVVVAVGVIAFVVGQSIGYEKGQLAGYSTGYYSGYHAGHDKGLEDGRFEFYYVKPTQKYGVDNLVNELNGLEWIKPYQEDVFDCSEMCAHLEWHLENEGWHTVIIVGDSPFSSGRRMHACMIN